MKQATALVCGVLLSLLVVGGASAQQKTANAQALQSLYGPNYEEIVAKYGDDPIRLQQAADAYQDAKNIRPFFFTGAQDDRYVVRAESEPNDYFDTADDIDDVLATPSVAIPAAAAPYTGGLIQASFTVGDFDVYKFTADPNKMYFFGTTHTYRGPVNVDEDQFTASVRLFHESDLDTTFVVAFGGEDGNDQIAGDILGRTTDHRANSGDSRLTGWTVPIDEATGEKVLGTYYLFYFNGEGGGAQRPIKSLGNEGTYYIGAYAIDLDPLVSRAEPNNTFEEALLNPSSELPTDAVVRAFMTFAPDTVKVAIAGVPSAGTIDPRPRQMNSVYSQLLEQGDEDVDIYAINNLKANHTLLVEMLPYYGYYRDVDGSIGPGNTRWADGLFSLHNAEFSAELVSSDDAGRESQSATGSPNNIHPRLTYAITEADLGAPLWLWAGAWASNTRNPEQAVDNRDPGRFPYYLYAHQYANDLVEANNEPNDTADEAMGIIPRTGEAIEGSFSGAGDVDYYRLFMNEMRMYNLLSYNSSVSGVIGVELYHESEDIDGNKTLSSNLLAGTGAQGASGNDFRIVGFVPAATGAYLLKVTGPSAGNYGLAVTDDPIFQRLIRAEPNDTAPDAIANAAILVGVGQPRQEGIIFPAGDVDHYVFNGLAGQQVNAKLQSISSGVVNDDFKGVVDLLDGGLSVVATGAASADAMSALSAALPADGQYILRVRAAAGTSAGNYGNNAVGMYSLNVGEPPREAEPNDTADNATLLLDGFLAGSLTSTDVDWYRVRAEAGKIYHVRSMNNTTGGAMQVDLYLASDPETSIHDGSDWNGRYGSSNFKVQILPAEDAEYLIKITPPAGGSGDYEVHMKSNAIEEIAAAFEPNNDAAAADAIGNIDPNGLVRRAMLYNPDNARFFDDVDVYRVQIDEPGKTLSCETLPFDGPNWGRDSDMFSRILAADGTTVLASNDDAAVVLEDGTLFDDWHTKSTYDVTEAGVYYCVLGSQDFLDDDNGGDDRDPTSGEYKFRISYSGAESEPNNEFETATLVQDFSTTEATMTEGDVDVFAFNLKAGNIYHIRTFRGEGLDSFSDTANLYLSTDTATDITDSETGGWRTRNNGSNIKLNIIPTEDATYYLRLGAPANLGTDGSYQVLMRSNPIEALAAAGEPNNSFDAADLLPEHPADGSVQQYMLYDAEGEDFNDDLDYFKVEANVGDILIAETLPFDGPTWPRDFDAYMYMYGPDRSQVANNDDNSVTLEDGATFDDWHSRIEYTVQTAGTHYILVVGEDAHVAPREQTSSRWRDPARGEYKFRLTKLTGVGVEDGEVPGKFELFANYPNPFNPTTTIEYQMPDASQVTLEVFNLLGQRVATLVDGLQAAGQYSVQFDASGLSSGMYLYRIKAGNYVSVRKMLLLK
ncbi:MAG: pre-peptidase C-terminal domain-containing protein [Rhodothermales bacterium]